MREESVLVTGGAGFIGSHLVDALLSQGNSVHVLDNLSNGKTEHIDRWLQQPNFTFTKDDLLTKTDWTDINDCRTVIHLAANPEVRVGSSKPEIHFQQNLQATFNLLEATRKKGKVSTCVFASSSTVYGDATGIPTPEDYAPLQPISVYGATKLACEALITAYAHTYDFNTIILRLANIIGPRSNHGVIIDLIQKLRMNQKTLEILGDGTQSKSYLLVDDCVEAFLLALSKSKEKITVLNVGSEDMVDVKKIASIIIEEMGLHDTQFTYTGGVDGGRGWKGDVKTMLLDVKHLRALGWRPKYTSDQAVRVTANRLLNSKQ